VIIYLLKSSACLVLFYAVYLLVFRSTDRFQLNRAYLLTGLVLSFVVPIVVVPATSIDIISTTVAEIYEPEGALQSTGLPLPETAGTFSIIRYLYYTGAAVALLITSISILKLFRLYWSADRSRRGKHTIMVHPDVQPCSFFGILFVRSQNEDPIIIAHEMVHIRQRHWVDLVLVEVAAIVLWFNPFIYFYRRSITVQHEYIADRHVVSTVSLRDYLGCITTQIESNILSALVSRFNTRSIKQRIIMLTNTKTYSAFRYAIVLPVVVVLTMAFATRDTANLFLMQNKELRSPVDVVKLRKEPGVGFGERMNPVTQKLTFHTGVDFVLAAGNGVYAAATGVVVEAASSESYGNFIIVRHDQTLTTSYSHLEKIDVKEGDKVQKGQTIGLVGSTGLSTGPHLHFEVLENGKAVNPVPYLDMSID